MVRAIERGLSLFDFNVMTPGMIIGYIVTFNDLFDSGNEKEVEREATQDDYDSF